MDRRRGPADGASMPYDRPARGSLAELANAFWQPAQADVLAPYVDRYAQVLPELGRAGMLVALSTTSMMFPIVGMAEGDLQRTIDAADGAEVSPLVRRVVVEKIDQQRRMVAARSQ